MLFPHICPTKPLIELILAHASYNVGIPIQQVHSDQIFLASPGILLAFDSQQDHGRAIWEIDAMVAASPHARFVDLTAFGFVNFEHTKNTMIELVRVKNRVVLANDLAYNQKRSWFVEHDRRLTDNQSHVNKFI